MSEARQIETEAATYLDQMSRYFLTRGKIVSKVAKYPHVVSRPCFLYSAFLQQSDESCITVFIIRLNLVFWVLASQN